MSSAVLNPQFFIDHPPNREFFQRFRGQFQWSEQVLPVYEWNELVFIAAVSPQDVSDQTATWPSHWILLKCDPVPLSATWDSWQEQEDDTKPRILMPELSEETSPPVPLARFESTNSSIDTVTKPKIPIPDLAKLNELSKDIPKTEPIAPPPVSDAFDPDQLFASELSSNNSKDVSSDDPFAGLELGEGFPDIEKPAGGESEIPEGLNFSEQPSETTAAAKFVAAPTPEPSIVEDSPSHEITSDNFPAATIKSLITKMPEVYTQSFFALKAGNSLRMISWRENFTPASGAEIDFSLSTPSPFRICTRTEKSYHGYIIASPFLDNFFKSWNAGDYPELMSVVPVAHPDGILGFIIAFGTADAMTKKHLSILEKMAEEAVKILVPSTSTARAS